MGPELRTRIQPPRSTSREWARTLLDNLSDPTVKRSTDALGAKQRKLVEAFIDKKELPATIENEFVTVLQQVLQGLEKITLRTPCNSSMS